MQYDVTSEKSAEIEVSVGAGGRIANLIPELGTTDLRLSWTKSKDPSVVRYEVQYGNNGIDFIGTGLEYVGNTNPANESPILVPTIGNTDVSFNSETPSILITELEVGMPYFFRIRAVDNNENMSDWVSVEDINGDIINLTPKGHSFGSADLNLIKKISAIVSRTTRGIAVTWE